MTSIYATIRIDFADAKGRGSEDIAAMVCERANAHNHTIDDGVTIENVELCGVNE